MIDKKTWRFFKRYWAYLQPYKRRIYGIIFLIVLIQSITVVPSYFLKIIVDLISSGAADFATLFFFTSMMFGSGVLTNLIRYLQARVSNKLTMDFELDLSLIIHKKLLDLSLRYHEQENTGNKITKIDKGIDNSTYMLVMFFWDIIPEIMQIAIIGLVLFWTSPAMGFLYLISAPLFWFITIYANKKARRSRDRLNKIGERASGILTQSIYNIFTVHSLSGQDKEYKNYSAQRMKMLTLSNALWINLFPKVSLYKDIFIDFVLFGIIVVGGYLITKNVLTVGTLVFGVTLTQRAFSSLRNLSHSFDYLQERVMKVDRLLTLLEEPIDIINKPNSIKPKSVDGHLEFKKVTFGFETRKEPTLKNISFFIGAGEKIAFVGPSGSGKSTIIKLLYRHYDIQKGKILVDGIDIRDYDIKSLRGYMAIVPQEVELFNGTVAENIAYGKSDKQVSFTEIERVSKLAYVDEFVQKFPKKYKTGVGERGLKLSGGQRQRIGIARALLADPRILIFDEATSNLDSQSERYIQEALSRISKNRTMIIIAHRLSTIRDCDRIFVIDDGRIVESGSHDELRFNEGIYQKLSKLQDAGEL